MYIFKVRSNHKIYGLNSSANFLENAYKKKTNPVYTHE